MKSIFTLLGLVVSTSVWAQATSQPSLVHVSVKVPTSIVQGGEYNDDIYLAFKNNSELKSIGIHENSDVPKKVLTFDGDSIISSDGLGSTRKFMCKADQRGRSDEKKCREIASRAITRYERIIIPQLVKKIEATKDPEAKKRLTSDLAVVNQAIGGIKSMNKLWIAAAAKDQPAQTLGAGVAPAQTPASGNGEKPGQKAVGGHSEQPDQTPKQ